MCDSLLIGVAGLHSLLPYFCSLILEELPKSIRSVERSRKLLQVLLPVLQC